MNFAPVVKFLPFLLSGVATTLLVSALSFLLGMTIGLILALFRLSSVAPLRWAASLYIDFFRSTPVLIQIIWLFFVLPIVTGIYLDAIPIGILALGLNLGAFAAEIYRSGILAVPTGQREAALSQGMTGLQAMRRVILPQAVRMVLPAIASAMISLVLDSSLVSVINVPELMSKANTVAGFTIRPLEVWSLVALIYLVLTMPLAVAVNKLQKRALSVVGGR
ncbi:MAG: amino acid ABC transporter permease [Candidatus Dormibacter sp.]